MLFDACVLCLELDIKLTIKVQMPPVIVPISFPNHASGYLSPAVNSVLYANYCHERSYC